MDDIAADEVMVTLPANMLAQIDAQIGGGFVDRQDFLRSAARYYLEHMQRANNAGPGKVIG